MSLSPRRQSHCRILDPDSPGLSSLLEKRSKEVALPQSFDGLENWSLGTTSFDLIGTSSKNLEHSGRSLPSPHRQQIRPSGERVNVSICGKDNLKNDTRSIQATVFLTKAHRPNHGNYHSCSVSKRSCCSGVKEGSSSARDLTMFLPSSTGTIDRSFAFDISSDDTSSSDSSDSDVPADDLQDSSTLSPKQLTGRQDKSDDPFDFKFFDQHLPPVEVGVIAPPTDDDSSMHFDDIEFPVQRKTPVEGSGNTSTTYESVESHSFDRYTPPSWHIFSQTSNQEHFMDLKPDTRIVSTKERQYRHEVSASEMRNSRSTLKGERRTLSCPNVWATKDDCIRWNQSMSKSTQMSGSENEDLSSKELKTKYSLSDNRCPAPLSPPKGDKKLLSSRRSTSLFGVAKTMEVELQKARRYSDAPLPVEQEACFGSDGRSSNAPVRGNIRGQLYSMEQLEHRSKRATYPRSRSNSCSALRGRIYRDTKTFSSLKNETSPVQTGRKGRRASMQLKPSSTQKYQSPTSARWAKQKIRSKCKNGSENVGMMKLDDLHLSF